jgi:hypothetical protein
MGDFPLYENDPEPLPSGSASGRFNIPKPALTEVFRRQPGFEKDEVFDKLYGPFREGSTTVALNSGKMYKPRIKVTVWGVNREELEEKAILEGKEFFPGAQLQIIWNTDGLFNQARQEWSAELIVIALVPATMYSPPSPDVDT